MKSLKLAKSTIENRDAERWSRSVAIHLAPAGPSHASRPPAGAGDLMTMTAQVDFARARERPPTKRRKKKSVAAGRRPRGRPSSFRGAELLFRPSARDDE